MWEIETESAIYLQENELYFVLLLSKWTEKVSGSWDSARRLSLCPAFPAFLSSGRSLILLASPSHSSLLSRFLCCCPVAAFYGPSQLPRPLQIALFIIDLPACSATVGWVSFVCPHYGFGGQPTCRPPLGQVPIFDQTAGQSVGRVPHPWPSTRPWQQGHDRGWLVRKGVSVPGSLCDNFSSCFSRSSFALKSI